MLPAMNAPGQFVKFQTVFDAVVSLSIAGLFAAPYLTSFGPRGLHERLHYLLPDMLILFIVFLRFRGDSLRRLGLAISARDGLRAGGLLAVGLLIAGWLVHEITLPGDVRIAGHRPFFSLTQVFHQEIVLRGLLLGTLASRISSRGVLAVGVAIAFAGLHPLLYWWRWDMVVNLTTALTLFSFALATNLLFLRTRHIGYAFAVHAAWNLQRFGTRYGQDADGHPITEWDSFASVEGSTLALGASVAMLAIVLVLESQFPRDRSASTSG
jgi:membrane protease YdiL (CAAX protease family)